MKISSFLLCTFSPIKPKIAYELCEKYQTDMIYKFLNLVMK